MLSSEILTDSSGTILLVDDQPDQIKIIISALTDHFLVKIAIRGDQVMPIASGGGIDLILLDIMMPDMDGYEICQQLKGDPTTRWIPVIFLTSKDGQEDESFGLNLGAVDFIRKPSSPAVLQARCYNTIAHHRAKVMLQQRNEELAHTLQKLQQSLEIREDMERLARHDLKGPLGVILGVPELMLSDDNLTKDQQQYLKMIEESGYLMLDMINKSLDLYKMETGSYPLEPIRFDLLEILHHIVKDLDKHAHSKGVSIVIESAEHGGRLESWFVMGEKLLCYSLFYNLILNAIEASFKDNSIKIILENHSECSKIRVINTGEVPHAIREQFFAKYVTYGKKQGTGLGTYSARLAATTQGGGIDLDCGTPGKTTIIVTLTHRSKTVTA